MIQGLDFALDRFTEFGRYFSDEIEDDPWMAYHGTSNRAEAAIEATGFCPYRATVTKANLEAVVRIFDDMQWRGSNGGGFPVLKHFSLGHDHLGGSHSPVYFAETSERACTFALHDFAGGEKCRGVRRSFQDLRCYIEFGPVRAEHEAQLEEQRLAGVCEEWSPVDLHWLTVQLDALAAVEERCNIAYEEHSHGLIYAVRFRELDVRNLRYNFTMGLKALEKIPPDRIVAKMRVPRDLEYPPCVHPRFFERSNEMRLREHGVFSEASKNDKVNNDSSDFAEE